MLYIDALGIHPVHAMHKPLIEQHPTAMLYFYLKVPALGQSVPHASSIDFLNVLLLPSQFLCLSRDLS